MRYLIAMVAFCLPIASMAEPLFNDGFESGSLNNSSNGVSYVSSKNISVTQEKAKDGSYAMKFSYPAAPLGTDSFSEQRVKYPQTNELWIKYDLYIPDNYYHRMDGASNNKFLAVFKTDYRSPGFQVNWSLQPNGSGGSSLSIHRYHNGQLQRAFEPSGGANLITPSDRGTWMTIMAQIKVPSSESANDGVMKMWKNGVLVCNETALNMYGGNGENYTDELYILGWANSGYTEATYFYVDNLLINNEPFVKPKNPTDTGVTE
ncbi:heparin lyase I family protein [Pleionea litopenaei]|uniref:Heparin lyase I family protein n=1 Tax=Pleionea litopenaei TaxID=3070815 RepID=A0AA51RRG8_9GAMM|nr:heparin lyase I family protein [Pleionea sp. HL-JVS1]WMS86195.1 heparin lyase I family protein [Pleionea sp. HL-JVS1]